MDIRVTSWTDLTERLYTDAWKPALGRFRSNFAFRGMQDANDDLKTDPAGNSGLRVAGGVIEAK